MGSGGGLIAVWLLALIAWYTYVPWDERRTRERVDALE
jgi:hypothetical protein